MGCCIVQMRTFAANGVTAARPASLECLNVSTYQHNCKDAGQLTGLWWLVAAQADETPLHYAAMNGHLELVKLLLGAGMDINAACKVRALHDCCHPSRHVPQL